MDEKLNEIDLQKLQGDILEVINRHNVKGAVIMLEMEDSNQLITHNLSYDEVKDHLCFANYYNEKCAIEYEEKMAAEK